MGFLLAIYYLLYGDESDQVEVESHITEMKRYSACESHLSSRRDAPRTIIDFLPLTALAAAIDYRARLKVLEVVRCFRAAKVGASLGVAIPAVESCLASLLEDGFHLLAGKSQALLGEFHVVC